MISKNRFLSIIIIFVLLTSTTIYFLNILVFNHPNFELIDKSYEDKMRSIAPYRYGYYMFIADSVEPNSTVLFFNYDFYMLAQPMLYPKIHLVYYSYYNDEDLLIFLRNNLIDYIAIVSGQHHLASNTTLYTKIDYRSEIYLLKINRSAL